MACPCEAHAPPQWMISNDLGKQYVGAIYLSLSAIKRDHTFIFPVPTPCSPVQVPAKSQTNTEKANVTDLNTLKQLWTFMTEYRIWW